MQETMENKPSSEFMHAFHKKFILNDNSWKILCI